MAFDLKFLNLVLNIVSIIIGVLGILAFAKVYNKDNFQSSSKEFCIPCSTTNADGSISFMNADGRSVQCQNVGDWLNSTGGIESLTKAMNSKGGIESLTSALKKIDRNETFNFNLGVWSEPIQINGITMQPSSTAEIMDWDIYTFMHQQELDR